MSLDTEFIKLVKTAITVNKEFIKKWLLTHWTNDEGEVNCLLANPENWKHIEAMGEHYRSQRWGEDEELATDDMGVDESLGWALTGLIEGGHEPPAGGHLPGCPYASGGRYYRAGKKKISAKLASAAYDTLVEAIARYLDEMYGKGDAWDEAYDKLLDCIDEVSE